MIYRILTAAALMLGATLGLGCLFFLVVRLIVALPAASRRLGLVGLQHGRL